MKNGDGLVNTKLILWVSLNRLRNNSGVPQKARNKMCVTEFSSSSHVPPAPTLFPRQSRTVALGKFKRPLNRLVKELELPPNPPRAVPTSLLELRGQSAQD